VTRCTGADEFAQGTVEGPQVAQVTVNPEKAQPLALVFHFSEPRLWNELYMASSAAWSPGSRGSEKIERRKKEKKRKRKRKENPSNHATSPNQKKRDLRDTACTVLPHSSSETHTRSERSPSPSESDGEERRVWLGA